MGLDINAVRFLIDARKRGVDFGEVITLGRQDLNVFPAKMIEVLEANGFPAVAFKEDKALYAEPAFLSLGAKKVHSLDASDFEALRDAILRWLAPVLSFTCDEAWRMYRPDAEPSVHLTLFPEGFDEFRDGALAARWETIRDVRRVVTGALELERAAKNIGSSLEASPLVYVSDKTIFSTLFDVDLDNGESWRESATYRPGDEAGVIDLPTIQRYLNFHFSVTIDLFGADESSNAAIFYNSGLKGRFEETKRDDDHRLQGQTYGVLAVQDGKLVERQVPMLNALNEVLRDDYIKDSIGGVNRWNKVIEKAGIPFRLVTPHKAFNRKIGTLSGVKVSPDGRVVSDAEWAANEKHWLPSAEDRAFVASLMGRVVEPGRFANWIAPPARGVNDQPVEFEYVRFN